MQSDWDLEIRKRFAQPLAIESGEFPDVGQIEARMLPVAYEAGLINGHSGDAAQFMSLATETYIKEVIGGLFSRTRINGPGDSGSAGFGSHASWVQTHKYQRQLAREEEAALRGEVTRDKSGFLPVEAKAASERGTLGMADLRVALEMSDAGMAQFPIITKQLLYSYREGELEGWDDYSWWDGERVRTDLDELHVGDDIPPLQATEAKVNGVAPPSSDAMDIDSDMWWEGAESQDMGGLDAVLDSCLAVG
jgi:transcriptional coactivator HFI1/ADA1